MKGYSPDGVYPYTRTSEFHYLSHRVVREFSQQTARRKPVVCYRVPDLLVGSFSTARQVRSGIRMKLGISTFDESVTDEWDS